MGYESVIADFAGSGPWDPDTYLKKNALVLKLKTLVFQIPEVQSINP